MRAPILHSSRLHVTKLVAHPDPTIITMYNNILHIIVENLLLTSIYNNLVFSLKSSGFGFYVINIYFSFS